MSTTEILEELAKMTPAERREIAIRLAAMDGASFALESRGIDVRGAAELRARLEQFSEDWDSPEMTAYDHYDAIKSAM